MPSSWLTPVCPPGAACRSRMTCSPNSRHHWTSRSRRFQPCPSNRSACPSPGSTKSRQCSGTRTVLKPAALMKSDVLLGDVSLAEFAPEARRLLRPDQSLDDAGDFSRRARTLELEHIAFGNQPVAEIDSLDVKAVAGPSTRRVPSAWTKSPDAAQPGAASKARKMVSRRTPKVRKAKLVPPPERGSRHRERALTKSL